MREVCGNLAKEKGINGNGEEFVEGFRESSMAKISE